MSADRSPPGPALSAERLLLLDRLLAEQGIEPAPDRIPPRPRDGQPLPLSHAQQRLWFIDRLQPGQALYNIPAALRLTAPIDPGVLRAALGDVIRRHEVLRTTFPTVRGTVQQRIGPPFLPELPVVDLRALPRPAREETLRRRIDEEGKRPFDLATGPLLRATLLTLADDEHVLVVNVHHIVFDA
jgi:hypothetical protein